MKYTPKLPIQAAQGMNRAALNRARNRPANPDDVITELCSMIVSEDGEYAILKIHPDMEKHFTQSERNSMKDTADIQEQQIFE